MHCLLFATLLILYFYILVMGRKFEGWMWWMLLEGSTTRWPSCSALRWAPATRPRGGTPAPATGSTTFTPRTFTSLRSSRGSILLGSRRSRFPRTSMLGSSTTGRSWSMTRENSKSSDVTLECRTVNGLWRAGGNHKTNTKQTQNKWQTNQNKYKTNSKQIQNTCVQN